MDDDRSHQLAAALTRACGVRPCESLNDGNACCQHRIPGAPAGAGAPWLSVDLSGWTSSQAGPSSHARARLKSPEHETTMMAILDPSTLAGTQHTVQRSATACFSKTWWLYTIYLPVVVRCTPSNVEKCYICMRPWTTLTRRSCLECRRGSCSMRPCVNRIKCHKIELLPHGHAPSVDVRLQRVLFTAFMSTGPCQVPLPRHFT